MKSVKAVSMSMFFVVAVSLSMAFPAAVGAQGPVHVLFVADRAHLDPGQCAVLEWHVEGGFEVQLNGLRVKRAGHWRVCPMKTTPYTLAVDAGDRVEWREIVIHVGGPPAPQMPQSAPPQSSPQQPAPQQPSAPMVISFRADRTQLNAGECTTLRWDVEHVKEVYLDGKGVVGHSSRKVCPKWTHTHVLHVVYHGGTAERKVTIHLKGGGSAPQQPGNPGGNKAPAPAPKARLAVTDLYANRLRGGKLFARITNHGPGTATNERVALSCQGAGWKGNSPTMIGNAGPQKISLSPGQTAAFDTGIAINIDQYDYYEMTCTVQGGFGTSGPYSERIP